MPCFSLSRLVCVCVLVTFVADGEVKTCFYHTTKITTFLVASCQVDATCAVWCLMETFL